jgi:hypothetical protein
MIESDIRRPARNNREFRDGWLADLAEMGSTRDVYAERQDPSTLSITGALRSREANMADRYGRDGRGSHDGYRAASSDSAQHPADEVQYDDEGALAQDEYDRQYGAAEESDDPQWTYDEKLGGWATASLTLKPMLPVRKIAMRLMPMTNISRRRPMRADRRENPAVAWAGLQPFCLSRRWPEAEPMPGTREPSSVATCRVWAARRRSSRPVPIR